LELEHDSGWIPLGYARTAITDRQVELEVQLRDLAAAGCRTVFSEQSSAGGKRVQLTAALNYVRDGDTLVVTKLDRLARSVRHLSELAELLENKGVQLRILNFSGEAVDTRGPSGRQLINMFTAMAQFEREVVLEAARGHCEGEGGGGG
jgi:DNA invertase Pin-like site-specific DNA recombinase